MKEIQVEFLRRLGHKLGNSRLLVFELAETLGISRSAAYNKLAGDSLLSTSQILLLCEKYGLDFFISRQKNRATAPVSFMPFHATEITIADYMGGLEAFLQRMGAASQKKLTCATDDIPVFHLFKYPEITAFKLHFWNARIRPNHKLVFDFDWPGRQLLQTAESLHHLYHTIPSVEIWTKSSLLNTVEQIKYARDAKIITDKKLGRVLCQQLRATLHDMEGYARHHAKGPGHSVPFDWFFYDIIGCITYLAETDGERNAFLRFNTFNTLQAGNGPLSDEVKHWLDGLVQDSTGFSGQGSKHRKQYLDQAYQQCDELEAMF